MLGTYFMKGTQTSSAISKDKLPEHVRNW